MVKNVKQPFIKRNILKIAGWILARPKLYNVFGKTMRWMLKYGPRSMVYSKLNAWGKARELPEATNENFNQWYKNRNKNE